MIREIRESDRELFFALAEEFYHSPAVERPLKEGQLADLWENLLHNPQVLGYILELEGRPCGYGIVVRSYSTEGGPTLWLEDIYLRKEARGRGLGTEYCRFILDSFPGVRRFRIEVEDANEGAVALYKKLGFRFLEYRQMIRDV